MFFFFEECNLFLICLLVCLFYWENMASIFTLENIADFSVNLNIDDLYEKKRQYDLTQLALYNKVLNRIHVRIKTVSRQKRDEQFCWFLVPEVIIGIPKFDQAACIAYLIDKMKTNGFNVRYIHPNALFISWIHWVPSYVRTELKKKTGIVVNEYGEREQKEDHEASSSSSSSPSVFQGAPNYFEHTNTTSAKTPAKKQYTPIKSYKPSGTLVYDDDLLNTIERKVM